MNPTSRRTWEEINWYAHRDLDELELRMETAPWWVIEGEELQREKTRLITIVMESEDHIRGEARREGETNGNNG